MAIIPEGTELQYFLNLLQDKFCISSFSEISAVPKKTNCGTLQSDPNFSNFSNVPTSVNTGEHSFCDVACGRRPEAISGVP
jgi:hypothetical protein